MLYRVHLAISGFELTTLVVIGTDCIGSWLTPIRSRPQRPFYVLGTELLILQELTFACKNWIFAWCCSKTVFCYTSVDTFIWFDNVINCQWRITHSSTRELLMHIDNINNFITGCSCFDPCNIRNSWDTFYRACNGVALTFNNICICSSNMDWRSPCKIK